MSDDSKTLSRVEDILSGEDYIPTKPMSRVEKLLLEGGGPGGKLPEVTSDDNGKILKVKDGAWDKGEDISGDKLPQVSSSDNGKVLKVVQGEWNIDKDEGDRLPTVTSADEGKVLKVKNGAWDKDVPEKELPETTSEDSGKALMINDNGDWAKSDIPDPAITAEASGNIASFSDGSNLPMPKLQVGIEPQQDLHGYDAPWVGGSGKNKLQVTATSQTINGVTFTVNSDGTIQVNGTATADADLWLKNRYGSSDSFVGVGDYIVNCLGCRSNVQFQIGYTSSVYRIIENENDTLINVTNNGISWALLRIISGTVISTPIIIKPMIRLSTETDPTFAPYSNICPISGWDEVDVTRTGKNVFGGLPMAENIVEVGRNATLDTTNKTVTFTSSVPKDGSYERSISEGFKFKENTIYTFVATYSNSGNNGSLRFRNTTGTNQEIQLANTNGQKTKIAVTMWEDYSLKDIILSFYSASSTTLYYEESGLFEGVITADDFEPYNGATYTIDLDGTRYGGTLDVVSGVLTVDRECVTYDGSENWVLYGSGSASAFAMVVDSTQYNLNVDTAPITNSLKGVPRSATWGDYADFVSYNNIRQIVCGINTITTPEAWKTYLASNNLQVMYELATPTTYQLTPTEVKSLLGSNNVWADTGEIESLIYYKQNAEDIADLIETLVPEELPAITPADNDKILTAYGGEWVPKTNPLPDARNYEAGSVLTVRNNHWNPELLPATPGVPRVESDDVGKVLKATGVDTYDWANGTDIIQTTQDSYDAMSDSQKMNGKLYFVHNESDDEEAAIYFMNKCYGKAPSGSKAVYLPLADYEELTTAEKEDPTKIYFVINEGTKVSPTLSADDGNFTVSSAQSGYDPWKVFDGSTRTDNNEYEYCYAPWGEHNGEWIAYSFGTKQIFSKVHIRAAVMRASTLKYYIEGSNDGETWTNLIPDADYVSVYHPALTSDNQYTWVNTDILLDTAKGKFNKIRFRQDLSIGYPYSGNRFNIANWDIYAAAASNKPSIYYKNVLYNPDELPATTISDAGKVLKVNEDGLWDKGDAPIPDINAVQVPPVIFDNGSLKKINDVNGFPGLEKVFLTPNGYETLTQAEKEDLGKIYYVSEYDYYSDKGGTLVLRVKNDEMKLFVNGFVDENTDLKDGNFAGIINDKIRELKGSYYIGSIAYDENKEPIGGSLPYVYIDANYSRISFRNASGDSSRVIHTTTYAVIDLTNYSRYQGSVLQSNPWEDPYDIPNGMTIYYGGKQYTEYEPAKPYVELTQAEYDALPSSKTTDGKMHFITDAGKIILNGIQYG